MLGNSHRGGNPYYKKIIITESGVPHLGLNLSAKSSYNYYKTKLKKFWELKLKIIPLILENLPMLLYGEEGQSGSLGNPGYATKQTNPEHM